MGIKDSLEANSTFVPCFKENFDVICPLYVRTLYMYTLTYTKNLAVGFSQIYMQIKLKWMFTVS